MRPVPDLSHLRFPLDSLLGRAGNLRVLRLLILAPAPQSVSQLAQATGLTAQGIRNVLEGFVSLGLAQVAGSGRSQVYSVNESHELMELVRPLFKAEHARWLSIRSGLRKAMANRPAVIAAWYYGSAARGEDVPGSDFDLALVIKGAGVDRTLAAVRSELRALEDRIGVSFSIVGLSMDDVARHAASEPASTWWQSVCRDAQVLKGDHPEQLAGELGAVA